MVKNGLYRTIGLIIGLSAMTAFVVYAIKMLRVEDLERCATLPAMLGIVIAAMFYVSIIPITSWAWGRLLADAGITKSWRELGMIMSITQMAKYLPGNVGQHIGRITMSMSRGIGIQALTVTMLIETALTPFAALLVGLVGAGLSRTGIMTLFQGNKIALVLALVAGCAVIIVLGSSRRFLPYLLRRYAPAYADTRWLTSLPRRTTLFQCLAMYCLNYIMIGVGLVILARLLFPEAAFQDAMLLIGSFALAWVAGFFTPGAPAGMGVREVIMLGLLSGSYSRTDGILLILALRLATILGDGLCFIAGNAMLLFSRHCGTDSLNDIKK